MTLARPRVTTAVGSGAIGVLMLGAVVLGTPIAASAHEPESGCEVASGSLAWGVKESFRSYVGSAIANGSWEVSDGADYTTPQFSWTAPSGAIDPRSGLGEVAFTGTIVFTGHGGVLHLELRDPVIHSGDDGATLVLDVLSNDPEGAVAIDEQDVVVATLPSDAVTNWDAGGTRAWEAIEPVILTEAGAAAFGGFYAAGDELDPIALEVTLSDECASAADPMPAQPASAASALIGGIVAAGALALGGVVAVVAAVRQRRRVSAATEAVPRRQGA